MTCWLFKLFSCKEKFQEQVGRLEQMRAHHAEPECHDYLCPHDLMEKMAQDRVKKHERRTFHNSLEFWTKDFFTPPKKVIEDKPIATGTITTKVRRECLEHELASRGETTLTDITQ